MIKKKTSKLVSNLDLLSFFCVTVSALATEIYTL